MVETSISPAMSSCAVAVSELRSTRAVATAWTALVATIALSATLAPSPAMLPPLLVTVESLLAVIIAFPLAFTARLPLTSTT